MTLALPLHLTVAGVGEGDGGEGTPRSTGLPGPKAPRGRAPLLLTYRAEAEPPPLPPSCPWVSRRGGREGGSGAGPVEDDAPPLSGRCRDSARAPACAAAHIGCRVGGPSASPGSSTPGHRHPRPPLS